MKFKVLSLILFIATTLGAWSQKPVFKGTFEGIGDNREFSGGHSLSQTILGTRGAVEAAFELGNHRLTAGISHLYEFGSPPDYHKPELILFYQFSDNKTTFHFGSFPRRELINFPLAMLTDTLLYYRPNIQGMRGEFRWDWGSQNAWVDWTGRQDEQVRESFTAATSGKISAGQFSLNNYFLLNHLAHSRPRQPHEHVNDNLGFALLTGWESGDSTAWTGFLRAGVLGSVFRERSVTDGTVNATSFLAESQLKFNQFAWRNTIHSGKGHIFMAGDPFYRRNNYLRSDLIWYFIRHKKINGRFNLSFHITDWKDFDQSQQISIVFIVD
jgi:hypothetical protein